MDNKEVTTVARALQETGMPTLRFNFRGVGASAGVFDNGLGETADADAVASWGAARWPGRALVAAGFSFGGYVALRLAQRRLPRQVITIAPAVPLFDAVDGWPFRVAHGSSFREMRMMWSIRRRSSAGRVNGLDPKPRLIVLPGVGHFFHGRLNVLRDAVIDAIRSG